VLLISQLNQLSADSCVFQAIFTFSYFYYFFSCSGLAGSVSSTELAIMDRGCFCCRRSLCGSESAVRSK